MTPEPFTIEVSRSAAHELRQLLAALRPQMRRLLQDAVEYPSVSGQERGFVEFMQAWVRSQGLLAESWETAEEALAAYPQAQMRHLPLEGRPTLRVRLPGAGGRSLLFNAHSDVVPPGEREAWRFDPWSGVEAAGRIYGRGAADDKGPLISALWAMASLRQALPGGAAGDVLLELVPGEEDCVGLGTLTSVAHGVRADGVIVLEPTECRPRRASRSGCRFRVETAGRAVHGTMKWLGADAIGRMQRVLEALQALEARWNEPGRDPLFGHYPLTRPVTVDAVQGGQGQGMIAERCWCEGYLELLPGDDLEAWKRRFDAALREAVQEPPEAAEGRLRISFGEEYQGYTTPAEDPLCRLAAAVARGGAEAEETEGLTGFNAGCEAGVRARLEGTPTLIWGPGSLAQAHGPDEYIEFEEVERVAAMFAELALAWTSGG